MNRSRAEHPAHIALFAGTARSGPGPIADLQVETLWDAFARMKFDAIMPGSVDLTDLAGMKPPTLKLITLANATYQDGKPIAPPALYKTVRTPAGKPVRVAIIGVIGEPTFAASMVPNSKVSPKELPWHVADPAPILKTLIPEARKKADLVVVMYSGSRENGRTLTTAVPGIDVMVVGLDYGTEYEKAGSTVIVQNTDRGRFAGQLSLKLDDKNQIVASGVTLTPLNSQIPDDFEMFKMVKDFRAKVAQPIKSTTPVVPASQSAWAGSQACASCHGAQFRQWKDTPHAHAMETLEKKDNGQPARRADCVACHTVAFDKPGGFNLTQARAELKGVGCESCHGAGAAHVKARQAGQMATAKLVKDPGQAVCVTCHNPDNSPNFHFANYRPRIVHTAAARTTSTATGQAGPKKL